jgi:hypothetical protein
MCLQFKNGLEIGIQICKNINTSVRILNTIPINDLWKCDNIQFPATGSNFIQVCYLAVIKFCLIKITVTHHKIHIQNTSNYSITSDPAQ